MPGIVKAIATEGQGTDELAERVAKHRKDIIKSGGLRERQEQRLQSQVKRIVEKTINSELWDEKGVEQLSSCIQPVLDGDLSPHELAQSIVDKYRRAR